MNCTERKFINYIGNCAFGEKQLKIYNHINYKEINLNEILELSRLHNVDSIIYSSLIKENSISKYSNSKIKYLLNRRETIELKDKDSLDYFFLITDKFQKYNIEFIILRGIFEKKLYPSHNHRIINEVEILIDKKDLNSVKNILSNLDYKFKYNIDGSNLKFTHDKYYSIIVHTSFFKVSSDMSIINKLQKDIWSNSIESSFINNKLTCLCDEDMLLYLSINIAKLLKNNNITILDICDFALLSTKLIDVLNWDSFFIKASICEVEKLLLSLFIISNQFFNTRIPDEYNINKIYNKKYINSLIDKILHPILPDEIKDEIVIDSLNKNHFKLSLQKLFKRDSISISTEQILTWLDLN